MKKALVLVDFQNDFIDGSLGTKEAQAFFLMSLKNSLNILKKIV
ncbi:hypothetical protein ICE98_01791 [Lactococcus lactis]|nr:hypothetical protein [Lactococcus lactis]